MKPGVEPISVCLKSEGKRFIEMLGKSYVLDILYFLFKKKEPVRFNQLKRELSITATTLSKRLEEFVEAGLVSREVFAEVPARVEYSCSKKGRTIGPVLNQLFDWVEKNNS